MFASIQTPNKLVIVCVMLPFTKVIHIWFTDNTAFYSPWSTTCNKCNRRALYDRGIYKYELYISFIRIQIKKVIWQIVMSNRSLNFTRKTGIIL